MDGGDRLVSGLRSGASYELAVGAVGDQTVYGNSLLSEPIVFETVPLPQLATPANLVFSDRMLEGDVVQGAMGYELVITQAELERGPYTYVTELSSFVMDGRKEIVPGDFRATVVALGDNITTADSNRSIIEAYLTEKAMAEQLAIPASLAWISETNTLSWGTVENASGYSVSYSKDGEDELFATTPAVFLVITDSLEPGVYSFKVKANGDGENYTDSEWTDHVEVKIQGQTPQPQEPEQLAVPTNLEWSNESSTLSWGAVENASGYIVSYEQDQTDVQLTEVDNTFVIIEDALDAGTYSFKVKAKGDGESYADSEWTDVLEITFEEPTLEQLRTPLGLVWDETTGTFTWDAVEHAAEYTASLAKGGTDERVYTTHETTFAIGEQSPGDYWFAVKALGDGVTYTDSQWSATLIITIAEAEPDPEPEPEPEPDVPTAKTYPELAEVYGFGYLTPEPATVGYI